MDRPLRFCMITSYYPPYNYGGDGMYVHRLSNELARRGHQVHVIHCIDAYRAFTGQDPPGTYHDHPNVTVHGLRSGLGILSPLLTHQTGFPVFKSGKIQRILAQGFDVIHYHTVSLVGGPGVLRYGQGIKLYTIHDHWLVCPTRVLFRFNRAICTRRHCFLCSFTHMRPPQLWRYTGLLQAAAKHVDRFLVGSRYSKEKHHELGLEAPIVHLPFFVPEGTKPMANELPAEIPPEPYFLFVGRLMKIKGLQTLIPIFRDYGKARLLIAGSGRHERQLRHLASGSAGVRFLDHVPYGQLQAFYRNAVALIVPSIAFEVAPLVIPEAFAQRTPVIVRNLGGLPEQVEESGGGFVYDTEEELVAAMDRLLANPAHRRELGQRGYQSYQQNLTAEVHLQRYLGLIRDIASTSPS